MIPNPTRQLLLRLAASLLVVLSAGANAETTDGESLFESNKFVLCKDIRSIATRIMIEFFIIDID